MKLKFSWKLIEFIYLVVVGGICWVLPLPELIKAFLALPGFLIIPCLVGEGVFIPIKKFLKIEASIEPIQNTLIYWGTGSIFITATAYLLEYLNLFYFKAYFLFILIPICFTFIINHKEKGPSVIKAIKVHYKEILIILLISATLFLSVSKLAPYPLEQGGDSLWHNYITNQIVNEDFFFFQIPYLSTLSVVVAVVTRFFNIIIDPYSFWWSARLILYVAYAFGIYLFSYAISKKRILALIAMFLGIFVMHHDTGLIYLNDFSPKAIILCLFPYLLFLMYRLGNSDDYFFFKTSTKKDLIKLILGVLTPFLVLIGIAYFSYSPGNFSILDFEGPLLSLFFIIQAGLIKVLFKDQKDRSLLFLFFVISDILVLTHTAMGAIEFVLVFSFFLLILLFKNKPLITTRMTYVLLFLVLIFLVSQLFQILNFSGTWLSYYGALSPVRDNFLGKLDVITSLYSPITLIFSLIGLISLFFSDKSRYIPLIFLSLFTFLLLFIPVSGLWRMIIFLNLFIAFLAARGAIKLENITQNKKMIFLILVTILLVGTVSQMISEINLVIRENGALSYGIDKETNKIGLFLKNNISGDFITLKYLPSLKSFFSEEYSNRLFYPVRAKNTKIPLCVAQIFLENSSKKSYNMIINLTKNRSPECEYYFSGMTEEQYALRPNKSKELINNRLSSKISLIIYLDSYSFSKMDKEYLNKFYEKEYFTVLYENKTSNNYIFAVNPEPGVAFKNSGNSDS